MYVPEKEPVQVYNCPINSARKKRYILDGNMVCALSNNMHDALTVQFGPKLRLLITDRMHKICYGFESNLVIMCVNI